MVYPNNRFDRQNIAWAFRFQQAMLRATKATDDGVKRARFMSVLRYQNRPAVLIEGGFLSNPSDLARIRSAEYLDALAQAVIEAVQ
jgi:N-acetylmuramoyl-L-alanine amidase